MDKSLVRAMFRPNLLHINRWKIFCLSYSLLLTLLLVLTEHNSRNSTAVIASAWQDTPATYYGVIESDPSVPAFVPTTEMLVNAYIDDIVCGTTQTQLVDNDIVYRIEVVADSSLGGIPNCGKEGSIVTFDVNHQRMAPNALWDNGQVSQLSLHPVLATPTRTGMLPTFTPSSTITPFATSTQTPTGTLPTPTPSSISMPHATSTQTPTRTLPTSIATPSIISPTSTQTIASTPRQSVTPTPTQNLKEIFLPLIGK